MYNFYIQPKYYFSREKRWHIHTIAAENGQSTHIVQILCKEYDVKFNFYGKLLSRITNTVELEQ